MPTVHISGNGFLADMLRAIVKAFQPVGIQLEIDTVPCLPTPIPPNYDRYVQIATVVLLCWVLTLLEPYGLRLRHIVMCYYHPLRAKQRAIWLYNHIMRSRNTFLKFARRQLRRKIFGDDTIAKVTCKEFLAANFKLCRLCLGEGAQNCCLLCGEVFRESDNKKPIKCQTPGCPGMYCEQCFADLQNLCTICLSPIEYGDISDISEEKDSSEEEGKIIIPKEPKKKKNWKKWFSCSKCCKRFCEESDNKEEPSKIKSLFQKKDDKGKDSSDEDSNLLKDRDEEDVDETTTHFASDEKENASHKIKDSDYYSSDSSTDYSYSYQYDKGYDYQPVAPPVASFRDIEKQEVPDYASMTSFREEADEIIASPEVMVDKSTTAVETQCIGTIISGTTFEACKRRRRVDFIGVPDTSRTSIRKKKLKKKRTSKTEEEHPLLRQDSSSCTCSDDEDNSRLQHLSSPVLKWLKSSSSMISQADESPHSTEDSDDDKKLYSVIGTETKSDIDYVQNLLPQLDLTDPQVIQLPVDDTVASSPECDIRCNHDYVRMMVPELDLSSVTLTPRSNKNYVSNIFGNVQYEEVSESPHSLSSSSIQHSSSTDVLASENVPAELHPSAVSVKVDKDIPSTSKANIDVGSPVQPADAYRFEENQKQKVKQYYKAVQDMPYRNIEEKKKTGKFMKFVQKIIPKRKRNTDEIPLYSRVRKEEVELKSYNYPTSNWGTSSSSTLNSAILRQQDASNRETSSGKEEEDRVRGGESGHIRNFRRSLTRCNIKETSLSGTGILDTAFSTKRSNYSKPNTVAKEVLARYFVSIEDLTPTRDCDIPMTTTEPSKTCNCSQELPEKDTPTKQDATVLCKVSATHISDILLTTPQLQTSSSSNLSEGFCTSVLGVPCTIEDYKTNSSRSFSLLSKEFIIKGDNLSVIPEECDKIKRPSSTGSKSRKCTMKEETCCKSQHDIPTETARVSKFCSCDSIVNKVGAAQTCRSPILKRHQKSKYISKSGACGERIERPTCNREATPKCRPRESSKHRRTCSTRDKTQQTCDDFICSETQLLSRNYCNCQNQDISHTQYTYSCCKCPSPPSRYDDLRDEQGAVPRRKTPGYIQNYTKYFSEIPSDYSIRSTYKSPDFSGYFTEFPADTHTSNTPRSRCERPKSRQKPGNVPACNCDGDCRCFMKRRKSPQLPMPSQYRCLKFESSTSSDFEDDYEDDESCYQDGRSNRNDLPYQSSDDYLDLVQELEETLQSRNRNRVRRAMQEFERRSKYNKPLEKPIIDYDETSESEEPIIQKITQLTSEKRRCCGGDMCNCRRETRMKPIQDMPCQPKQRSRMKTPPCRTPYSTQSEGSKTHWQMDKNSGEWYKVSENQQRFKNRRKSRTPSPRKSCPHNCNCCTAKGYNYR